MKTTSILTIITALLLPMCANNPKHHGAHRTQSELESAFYRKDKNHDGYLSRTEFIANSKDPGKATRIFIKKDTNGDNRLSEQEFIMKIAPSR